MKLLYALNEARPGTHQDIHRAAAHLRQAGDLEECEIYPFEFALANGQGAAEVADQILETARRFEPTVILWSHTPNLPVPAAAISSLRQLSSRPVLGYADGDVYDTCKPVPQCVFELASRCDASFWSGYFRQLEALRRKGHDAMHYAPCHSDADTFGRTRTAPPDFDVVMIGNRIRSRIPWRTWPGAVMRSRLAALFQRKLGRRFAVFGNGWTGPCAHGPVPFLEQGLTAHRGRITLGCNNIFCDYYFSNRLPIALTSGVFMVHNHQKELPRICGGMTCPIFFSSPGEAWEIVRWLLSRPQEELDAQAAQARAYALDHLTAACWLRYVLQVLNAYREARLRGERPAVPSNPWIGEPLL